MGRGSVWTLPLVSYIMDQVGVRSGLEVVTTRDQVIDAFSDSAAMPGNEAHFERVLSEHETALRANVIREVVEWLRHIDQGLQHSWAKKSADAIERKFGDK